MRVRYSFSSRHTGTIDNTNKHKTPIPAMVKEVIRISDIVLEVLDARFLKETRNIELERMIIDLGKKIVFVLNKADLIDVQELKQSGKLEELAPYVFISAKTRIGVKELRTRIKIEAKRMKQQRTTHIGIIGYPNTGKSSIINVLAGGGHARTAAEAGFTKGMQKIRLAKGILLLDTPGVMPEREAPAHQTLHAKKLSLIGVKTFDKAKNPELVVFQIMKAYPGVLENFYGIEAEGDSEKLIEELGRRYKFLAKGGKIDSDRAARMILKDWQIGKIKKE
jgi:hypothetical protein